MPKATAKRSTSTTQAEATTGKPPAANIDRPTKSDSGVEAISRHCDAAISCGGNDCRDDGGDRLAAALGARLPCWGRAQAPQIEAPIEEGRW